MTKFDLGKTQRIQDLLAVERDQRDPHWISRFYAAIVDASMATTSDQIMQGPDGFPYFVLNLPPAGQPFETFCVSHVLDGCLKNGTGVVIQPEPHPPQWVFPYGLLWSLKEYGEFMVDAGSGEDAEEPAATGNEDGRQVLAAQPSAAFFPPYARQVIRQFLKKEAGISDPEVLLVSDPGSQFAQSLAFNVFQEDFEPQQFENIMYRLTWFLPRHYGLMSLPRDSELAKSFEPL